MMHLEHSPGSGKTRSWRAAEDEIAATDMFIELIDGDAK